MTHKYMTMISFGSSPYLDHWDKSGCVRFISSREVRDTPSVSCHTSWQHLTEVIPLQFETTPSLRTTTHSLSLPTLLRKLPLSCYEPRRVLGRSTRVLSISRLSACVLSRSRFTKLPIASSAFARRKQETVLAVAVRTESMYFEISIIIDVVWSFFLLTCNYPEVTY
jgi:hypothetical protein